MSKRKPNLQARANHRAPATMPIPLRTMPIPDDAELKAELAGDLLYTDHHGLTVYRRGYRQRDDGVTVQTPLTRLRPKLKGKAQVKAAKRQRQAERRT